MKVLKNYRNFHFWFRNKYKTRVAYDIIEEYKANTIYLIKDTDKNPWLITFLCPCGCKSEIHLNLLKEANPCWNYVVDKKNRITIRPSVNRTVGCKSHFNIIKGRIYWV
ncbi:hypothetical protein D1164_04580 [Mariniphaga sediminis]|uniref:Uncharacterized protein n=1 Tax=Mariniphaga sediminis TaxID=1628158 RepID=A0A399D6C6_9BACT|nr:hypothetical protein D1164_04580 [Mariniphaga sediminis]